MATSIQVTLPEAAAAAISTPAVAADADLVTKSNSDAHSTDLQTQLSDRLYLKPDTVSSAIYHADTEVDTDNEDAEREKYRCPPGPGNHFIFNERAGRMNLATHLGNVCDGHRLRGYR